MPQKKNENWEKKEWIEKLNEYKDLSIEDFENKKIKITELFDKKILTDDDEDNKGYYNKLFTCLYGKKDAINLLIDKIGENIDNLKEKIDPTNTTVNFKNISDTKACIRCIDDMRKMKDYELIFGKIKNQIKSKLINLKVIQKIIQILLIQINIIIFKKIFMSKLNLLLKKN